MREPQAARLRPSGRCGCRAATEADRSVGMSTTAECTIRCVAGRRAGGQAASKVPAVR
jgi:hypothetical protein